jgi:hypothetical protein
LLPACSKLVDNLGQAVRTQLVDGLLADLLQDVRFLHVYDDTIKQNRTENNLSFFVFTGGNDALRSSAIIDRIIKRASRIFDTSQEQLTLYKVG